MKKILVTIIAGVLCLPFLAWAADEEGYYSRSYARLNVVSGDVYIQRAGNLGYEAGTVNLPLSESDKLGTREGRVEVQFGGRNYLRADRLTQVDFVNLPRQDTDPYKLHLLAGSIYLRVGSMLVDKAFEVHTPDASFYILEEGLYRFNLLTNQQTELQVLSGSCEAAGQGGSVVVHAQERIIASNGNLRSNPEVFAAVYDEFARWNESRESLLAQSVSQSYLPSDLEEYESEFDDYGTWQYEPTYGYVWVPHVYYSGWRPYYYGHWVWFPIIGWTWVSDEPWGWAAYHYGRWHWGPDWGWYWIPTSYWGPCWVDWWWDNDYIGWCPLNYWNNPVVIINNFFYSNYNGGYYPYQNNALTVVNRNQLQSPRVSDVALSRDGLRRLNPIQMSGRQPNIPAKFERSGSLSRQAEKTFAAMGSRPVSRAFGSSNSPAGRLGDLRSGSTIKDRNLAGSERQVLRNSGTNRSTEFRSNNATARDSQSRNIRSFPSREFNSRPSSSRTTSGIGSTESRTSSSSRIRNSSSARDTSSSRSGSSSSGSSVRSNRRDSSTSGVSGSGRAIREYRSSQSSPVSRFRSSSGSDSSSGTSSSRRSSSSSSAVRDRSFRSGSSALNSSRSRDSVSAWSSRSSSGSSSMGTYRSSSRLGSANTNRESRSYSSSSSSSPSRYSRSTSRSYSSPSWSSGSSSRSYSGSSRSYSSPSRSTSGSSWSGSRSSSRSYSAPSRGSSWGSSSRSSRSYSSPSRSSSGSSRSSSGSFRSSGSSSRSSSSSSSSSSRGHRKD